MEGEYWLGDASSCSGLTNGVAAARKASKGAMSVGGGGDKVHCPIPFDLDSSVGGRSSDEGVTNSGGENSRARVVKKIDKCKEALKEAILAREADVEKYIRMTSGMASNAAENAQLMRIRQHFEKKNKKHTLDTEQMQRKLEQFESRLHEIDYGYPLPAAGAFSSLPPLTYSSVHLSGSRTVLSNVGQGISSVMAMPRGLASRLKHKFGSVDNLDRLASPGVGAVRGSDVESGMPQRAADVLALQPAKLMLPINWQQPPASSSDVFYNDDACPYGRQDQSENVDGTRSRTHSASGEQRSCSSESSPAAAHRIPPPPPAGRQRRRAETAKFYVASARSPQSAAAPNTSQSQVDSFLQELQRIKQRQDDVQANFEALRNQIQAEYSGEQFRYQRLEEQLNDTAELHQAEIINLRNDIQNIANRLEYQYMDKFRDVQDTVDGLQNRVSLFEQHMADSGSMRIGDQSVWNYALLSGGNIMVETIKLFLFIISVLLDSMKPLLGSRSRSAVGLVLLLAVLFLSGKFDFVGKMVAMFTPWSRSNSATSPSELGATPEPDLIPGTASIKEE